MSFKDTSVIITGGSKGIGLSIAKVFSRNTNRPLVLIARNIKELEDARNECQEEGADQVDIIELDLTNTAKISKIDFAKYNPGILVNNAGLYLYKTLQETTEEEFKSQFEINAFGAFNITKRVLPELKKQDRGLIVNICSQASLRGYSESGAYTMSKHAELGYSRSLRNELMDTQVAVSAINLGQTYSTSWEGIDVDPDKLIDPEDVGRIIVSLSELTVRSVAEEINLMPQGGEVNPV